MDKLKGKVAVITGATSGMALASAKLFVEEGVYVFITGRHLGKLNLSAPVRSQRLFVSVEAQYANTVETPAGNTLGGFAFST